ncbi:hypothetical protein DTO166G4_8635 [Paecilomyces variotii]|uniref:Putative GTP-binding protein EsdC n=1 Tax=Byssochlamys spectabilis TaxID=264951 RepID=A0A443HMP6_BYSSP|nr:putative GTP-binding protein EsdC [Paecilomyces variotii]KAJ9200409.1 hypothetical protein DTO164E3_3984 [Paecilomyces variotii]KAJ9208214.1 hypothetical protein DTO032I3_885 [Paecilomyces variotii]KAJ9209783.1 hypothetical protein DTO166G4_8635 [Paecilomyces variotii]KAJ9225042.1 hypothetical protein DTO169C6_2670 [Paecilomyces variotii]KAJ9228435.1 hypothetical protein DTO166G5_8590 [Paecilomyces variotii]
MATVQLNFSLRTSANVKTVHLVGSWDKYSRQLPLSKDTSKSGSWTGKFRFQTSMLKLGGRYWYYYIMDGYHVSHDPAQEYTVEKTTGRKLNVLDVPDPRSPTSSSHHSRRQSTDIPKGRALSPSKIQHPRPSKPYESRQIREDDFIVEELADQLASSRLSDGYYSNSPPSSVGSSLSSRSDSSSPSSLSSMSDPPTPICRCERYGITRKGDRVKLDCGGSRCGYFTESSEGSDCSSDAESDHDYRVAKSAARRQGIVVRR